MGAGSILLICYMSSTIYTYALSAHDEAVYVPKSPRRPIIMVWPSVMNPAVAKAITEKLEQWEKNKEYMKIICISESNKSVPTFRINVVRQEILQFPEQRQAPFFWTGFVPKLIQWVSREAIECGFPTIFPNEQEQIFRFIKANRSNWIRAVQELVYILLQVIFVTSYKTGKPPGEPPYSIERWAQVYEGVVRKSEAILETILQKYILKSLDIVVAWLFDYMAERTRLYSRYRRNRPFWPHANKDIWNLSDDRDIVCALENSDTAVNWEYLLDTVTDKMETMAKYFITCKVLSGCIYETPINIYIGHKNSDVIVRIPEPEECILSCNDLPTAPYSQTSPYSSREYKSAIYAHAHMTTVVGHELYCAINSVSVIQSQVRLDCYPVVVEKYLTERKYKICKSTRCERACCKASPFPFQPQPRCEIVTAAVSYADPEFMIISSINLTKLYPDVE